MLFPLLVGHTFLFLCMFHVVVQLLSHVWPFMAPWSAAHQASLSFTIPWSLPKLTSSESVMPSNHLILSPPSPPVLSPSQHQGLLFQWVDSSHQVAKVLEHQIHHQSFQWISSVQSLNQVQLIVTPWTAGHQASPTITNSRSLLKLMSIVSVMPSKHLIPWKFNEYSGLISFRVDWFDGLSVQGTPASPFESISYSVLSFLHGPTLTSIHDYWKNHIFDYMFHKCWKLVILDCILQQF